MEIENNEEKQGTGPLSAPPSALAAPDSAGYWWLMAHGGREWELIRVMDDGDGWLRASSIFGRWCGLTIGRGFDYEETTGEWVKIHKPNDPSSPTAADGDGGAERKHGN